MNDDLYQDYLLDNYKNPQNVGKIADPSITVTEYNASCGDAVEVDLKIDGDKGNYYLTEMKWRGNGCSVSMATTSILSQLLVGKEITSILELDLAKVQDMIGIKVSVGRVKCLTLAIKAISKAINQFLEKN